MEVSTADVVPLGGEDSGGCGGGRGTTAAVDEAVVELKDVGVGLLLKVDAVAHRSFAFFLVSLFLVFRVKFCFSAFVLGLSSTMLTFFALIKSPMNDCKGEMGVFEDDADFL